MTRNPITRVEARGEPFALGHALGEASAKGLAARVFATDEYRALDAAWRGSDRLRELEEAARRTYPRYVREIEGIAAGAGQDFETLFLWNCRGDLRLPEGASAAAQASASSGCTTLLIPAQGEQDAMIAHNEDGAPELLGACLWVRCAPDEGPGFESFMYPGMLPGHTFGVSGAGLVQTINNIRAHDLQPGVPRQIVCRAVLDCATLDEALGVLRRRDRASGFHHNLGEVGSRRVVSVEAPASGCETREPEAPIAHANHLIYDAFAGLEQVVTASSKARQERADELIAAGALAEAPEAVLFDRGAPIRCDHDGRDDYSQTLATAVFEIRRDRVDWRAHAAPDDLSALSGSVPAP
ncbi:MAG: C45 family autoproteolytic acyltransferase/hydrolase [Pseudomonadota bacterium]